MIKQVINSCYVVTPTPNGKTITQLVEPLKNNPEITIIVGSKEFKDEILLSLYL